MKTKIKSFLVALIATLVLTFFAPFGVAGGGGGTTTTTTVAVNPEKDPERIADAAMLGKKVVKYRFEVGFYRQMEKGEPGSRWVYGRCELNLQGFITLQVIDGVEIPIDPQKPLKGLALNKEGMAVDFNAWCYGLVGLAGGEEVSFGHYFTRVWRGEAISFEMLPVNQRAILAYKAPEGVNPNNLRLMLPNGNSFGYGSRDGGFSVWLDPLLRNQGYQIVDTSTGEVLQRGIIDPFSSNMPMVSSTSPINIGWAEGVREISISETNRNAWFENQQLTTTLKRGDKLYPARVYYADLQDAGVSLWFYDLKSGRAVVEVYGVRPDGEDLLATGGYSSALREVTLNGYFQKIRVVVIGDSTDAVEPYGFQFSATWNEGRPQPSPGPLPEPVGVGE